MKKTPNSANRIPILSVWHRSPSSDPALRGACFAPGSPRARGHILWGGWAALTTVLWRETPSQRARGTTAGFFPWETQLRAAAHPSNTSSYPGSPSPSTWVPLWMDTSSGNTAFQQGHAWAHSSPEVSCTHKTGCPLGVAGTLRAGGAGALLSSTPVIHHPDRGLCAAAPTPQPTFHPDVY